MEAEAATTRLAAPAGRRCEPRPAAAAWSRGAVCWGAIILGRRLQGGLCTGRILQKFRHARYIAAHRPPQDRNKPRHAGQGAQGPFRACSTLHGWRTSTRSVQSSKRAGLRPTWRACASVRFGRTTTVRSATSSSARADTHLQAIVALLSQLTFAPPVPLEAFAERVRELAAGQERVLVVTGAFSSSGSLLPHWYPHGCGAIAPPRMLTLPVQDGDDGPLLACGTLLLQRKIARGLGLCGHVGAYRAEAGRLLLPLLCSPPSSKRGSPGRQTAAMCCSVPL